MENIPTSVSSNITVSNLEENSDKIQKMNPKMEKMVEVDSSAVTEDLQTSLPAPPPQESNTNTSQVKSRVNPAAVMPPPPPPPLPQTRDNEHNNEDTEDEADIGEDIDKNTTGDSDNNHDDIPLPPNQPTTLWDIYKGDVASPMRTERGVIANGQFNFDDDEEEPTDEWENDDDPGIIMVPVTEDEFLDLEDEAMGYYEDDEDDDTDGKAPNEDDISDAINALNNSSINENEKGKKKTLKDTFGAGRLLHSRSFFVICLFLAECM